MKLTHIALASVALAVAAQAQAVTRISGATATSNNYIRVLFDQCPSNNVSLYKNSTSSSSLGNNFTLKCNSGNFGDSGENEARFDVTGGSINSVLFTPQAAANGEPLAGSGKFIAAAGVGCSGTAIAGSGVLGFLNAGATPGNKIFTGCTTSSLPAEKSVGGFTDVEPAIFKATGVLVSDYSASSATFSQVFGVGVSQALYQALQSQQGLTVGSTTPANQPTISRAKLAALMNNNDFNNAKALGPKFLVTSTAETNITYCRRPNTSGTQASAQLYFMANPVATGNLGGALTIHGPDADGSSAEVVAGLDPLTFEPTGNTLTVSMNSGSGNVRTCLNAAGFSFGVLSAENNPVGGSDTYRFVKISNVSMTGGLSPAAGETQTATAISGDFDFVYESALFNPTGNALLDLMNNQMLVGAPTAGLFLNASSVAPETACGRGGNSVAPYVCN
jgi:hypothetical protein